MKTSMDVQELWLYASDCCLQEVLFDSGESFSRCPRCSNLCEWEKVDVGSDTMKAMNDVSRTTKPSSNNPFRPAVELLHSL